MDWILLGLVWHLDEKTPLLANKLHHVGSNEGKLNNLLKLQPSFRTIFYAPEACHRLPDGSLGVGYVVCQGVLREWCHGHGALLGGVEVFGCFCFRGNLWQTREVINCVENGENTPCVIWKQQCEEGFWRPLLLGGEHPNISSCDTMQLVQQWIVIHHMQK